MKTGLFGIVAGLVFSLNSWAAPNVVVWGDNTYGQTNVPSGLTNAVQIAAGTDHCVALTADGRVFAWGSDSWGQSDVPGEIGTNAIRILATGQSSLAVLADGSVVKWGCAGVNPDGNQFTGFTDACGATSLTVAGTNAVLAIMDDGCTAAWGSGGCSLTNVPSAHTNAGCIQEFGGGINHSCLLCPESHTVTAWGDNTYGQTDVPASATNVTCVRGGLKYTIALRSDGKVVSWGNNAAPQIKTALTPGNYFVAIAAGYTHNLALRDNGKALGWGTTLGISVPTSSWGAIGIAAGKDFSMALMPLP